MHSRNFFFLLMATLVPVTIKNSPVVLKKQTTSTATADTFTLSDLEEFDSITISADGLSADTLVFSRSIDGTSFKSILDEFGLNPFEAPSEDQIQTISLANITDLKMVRTGATDGDIVITILLNKKK